MRTETLKALRRLAGRVCRSRRVSGHVQVTYDPFSNIVAISLPLPLNNRAARRFWPVWGVTLPI